MLVLMAGGGTAGHTSPLLATAAALQRLVTDVEIVALGTASGLETRVVPAAGYELELVPRVPMPRRVSADLARLPMNLGRAVRAAAEVIERRDPAVVVGFGGYVSVPAYLAARRRGIPIVVHEGNALPGLANRLGARLTTRVATSFPDTALRHGRYVGLPIRTMISRLDRVARRAEARAFFGLRQDLPTILVTGGSQGARRINETMATLRGSLAEAGVQVLHVVGPRTDPAPADPARADPAPADSGPPYVVIDFVERMDLAYAAADLVVCRAGANSVTEAAAVGLPAVFVPLPIGNGEQALNARGVVAAGGGLLIDDAGFTPHWARNTLPGLAVDTERLAGMARAATDLVPRDADVQLARMILAAGQAVR